MQQIGMLETTTAHPLLMNLLDRHESNAIDNATLLGCLDDLSSFVLRRSICGESTRSYGRWFVEATAAIKDDPQEDLRKYWVRRGWPDDAAFVPRLIDFPLYRRESRKCRLVLLALEAFYGHKEKVDPNTLSIEHVMPQTIKSGKSGKAWQVMLGDRWKADHETYLHTIGNLTLTGYNQDLSNKPFPKKQAELVNSNLVLNQAFENVATWNADTIRSRGETLAAEVAKLWPRPEGGDYVPPVATGSEKLTPAERRQRRLDYWTELLSVVEERGVPSKRPEALASRLAGLSPRKERVPPAGVHQPQQEVHRRRSGMPWEHRQGELRPSTGTQDRNRIGHRRETTLAGTATAEIIAYHAQADWCVAIQA